MMNHLRWKWWWLKFRLYLNHHHHHHHHHHHTMLIGKFEVPFHYRYQTPTTHPFVHRYNTAGCDEEWWRRVKHIISHFEIIFKLPSINKWGVKKSNIIAISSQIHITTDHRIMMNQKYEYSHFVLTNEIYILLHHHRYCYSQ